MISDAGWQLLQRLADGRWHSGQRLAAALGVSRAAVWKRLQPLRALPGVELERAPGRGYRLRPALELLQAERLLQAMAPEHRRSLEGLHLLAQVDSTNSELQRRPAPALHCGRACLAEYQQAGRGRRGRRWIGGFGCNLLLSLAWRFDLGLGGLAGLSLAAGVAVAEALEAEGLRRHRLKWPNDLLVDGAKLAGILVEAGGEADGPCTAIIGVGLNLSLEGEPAAAIDQPWTELVRHLDPLPSRNRLAGRVLDRLVAACRRYQQEGLASFLPAWRARDALAGEVRLITGRGVRSGRYHGIDAQGALLLETATGLERHHAGEVSLERAP